ncbi:fumarylacetoacetate hydrolase family protein [Pseudohalocynthiibacter aestuariivivens]|jgi:fumarylpyruvate hydrolase|uniref:Fumarylacetoacetate hydrolase family protein n=1 Tax=Pseudohalocynthiibacter aestuariivivens TaxID=1591409 RepID=A0ABV5JJN0_9RHOB|nr:MULTISPECIES: fumarylacetoacetate hydrolase family protein [Pseudohalocynthiibacter]MBS9717400.1 fumarylacetoacetate hydrolase family protein [Pseudohalocynthiibacter aestuariivivens]MCK0102266.1 fumarylacetoacetate hydrolase family protein [Pseudohalocynthiibacter sp. F2068]
MTTFVLPLPEPPSVAIAKSENRFPVRRIFCVGRNYAEHAREMGNDPDREPPFFFTKPADCVIDDGAVLPFPTHTKNLHHEAELVVAIGTGGAGISPDEALNHVWGYGPGNDLTRRDLQAEAKASRRPWDMAKGFDHSAACGALHPVSEVGHPDQARITATVNDNLRQDGDIADMIWPVADVIAYLSGLVILAPGDLIFTGTPAGVGSIKHGESCRVEIDGLGSVSVSFR